MSRPSSIRLNLAFRVKGLGVPTYIDLDLAFAVNAPEATIYVFDRGDWQPAAQRVRTADGEWFPATV